MSFFMQCNFYPAPSIISTNHYELPITCTGSKSSPCLRYDYLLNYWVDAASGIMQAKDQHDKDARNNRIKEANRAAGY